MKSFGVFLLFILFAQHAFTQSTIKGKVVNEATDQAVPGSSVFISNTSKGTVTNNDGYFELHNVPPGKHDLVVSGIGYETNVFTFSSADLPLQLKVEMKIKVKEMENVVLEPFVEEGWDRWGNVFMEQYVGRSANGKDCRIKNEKAIVFRYYRRTNRLIAYCDEPIVMENKALGYLVKFKLENFEVNFNQRSSNFIGYPLYEEMASDRKNLQEKWERKRVAAYNGSIMHFIRSIYENKLKEEGFLVRRMRKIPNREKQRVKNLFNNVLVWKTDKSSHRPVIENRDGTSLSKDTMGYYQIVMRQKDEIELYGQSELSADSLLIDTNDNYKAIHFEDYIYITYLREKEEPEYLLTQFPVRVADLQRSFVTLLNEKVIVIDKNGNYYNPQDFFTSHYWGWSEKMANSLPLDYEPPSKMSK